MEVIAKTLKSRWKIFVLSLIAQFVVTVLLSLGTKPPEALKIFGLQNYEFKKTLTDPKPQNDIFEFINPKLEQKKNNFKLIKNGTSLIPAALAGGEYDKAAGYIVVNFDSGEILAEKDGFKKLPIASITKVMTAIVALDLASVDENLTISDRASRALPSKVMLKPGEKVSLNLLLHCLLMASANDAAEAIRDGIDQKYGAEVFTLAMNKKAKIIGLENSHFNNPEGLDDPEHLSSATDVAILSKYALENYPLISQIVAKDYVRFPDEEDRFNLRNWNGLLGVYPGVKGVKIGNTEEAGKTTAVLAGREGKEVLVVLLGAPGVLERDLWASELLNLGFEKLGVKSFTVSKESLKAKYLSWRN